MVWNRMFENRAASVPFSCSGRPSQDAKPCRHSSRMSAEPIGHASGTNLTTVPTGHWKVPGSRALPTAPPTTRENGCVAMFSLDVCADTALTR